ncbi:MAG: YhbY family RNA-binding protein [Methanosarcinales archaeon Met12]|nr:MAG: YhbY family RNA-binding protein [Methanosarcinales archaeon Met12]
MDKKRLYKLKSDAALLDPVMQVGKNGVTEMLADELKGQLKKMRLVKVKFLRSATDGAGIEQVAQQLSQATKSELIEIRGRTAVYFKR